MTSVAERAGISEIMSAERALGQTMLQALQPNATAEDKISATALLRGRRKQVSRIFWLESPAASADSVSEVYLFWQGVKPRGLFRRSLDVIGARTVAATVEPDGQIWFNGINVGSPNWQMNSLAYFQQAVDAIRERGQTN